VSDELREGASETTRRVRALIIYHHALLGDLATKVLSENGVEVVAAVRPEDFDESLLDLLKPKVLVVDRAVLELEGTLRGAALLSNNSEIAARVVLVDLSDPNMLIWQKRTIANTDAAKLVDAVVGPLEKCA
jgi:hypothetical protein